MDKFIVSARKYRPVTFDTVVGQPGITQTLKNAIINNHLAQAFLFTGPRGVGKTTTARILAKTINCENISANVEACNACPSCLSFNEGHSMNIYELDAASNNSVDDIRALVEQVRYPPQLGKYKVYIIDEVHMLSAAAFNAFLKTLEEPPSYAIFILATTEKHKIIPTILSRCQIFDFHRISIENIVKHLQIIAGKEGIDAEEDALHIIAQKADGALRDSLSMFDQLVSFAGNKLTYKHVIENLNILDYDYYFKITDDLLAGNISNILLTFNEILNKGFDPHNFINGLSTHFRDLLVCKDEITLVLLEVSTNVREKYKIQSRFCDSAWLLKQLEIANTADVSFKSAKNQRLHIELALLRMCKLNSTTVAEPVKKKVESSLNAPVPPKASLPQTEVSKDVPQHPTPATPVVPVNTEKHVPSTIKKTISISGKKSGDAEKKTEVVTEDVLPDLAQPFSEALLQNFWNKYAEQLLKEGKMTLHTALTKSKPQIVDENILLFQVDSAAIEKDLNENKTTMLAYLRKNLSNYKINMKVEVFVSIQNSDNPYTPSEKFKKLAEKNPLINDLKNNLDLEIDY
jgi:DNA polymerase-3 subunit gamma/tau